MTTPTTWTSDEEVGRTAVTRRVLTEKQLQDCIALMGEIEEEHGFALPLGEIILERVYASNPKARPILVRPSGVTEILGPGIRLPWLKLPKAGHDSLLERIARDDLIGDERMESARRIQESLARKGILKRVGEILIQQGYIDREMAQDCLRPTPEMEALPAFAFARIAIHNGLISERDAADAIELSSQISEHLHIHLPIGQIFYEIGLLRQTEVEAILGAQVEVGRLKPEEAHLRILKLSEPEEKFLSLRLLQAGTLTENHRKEAREKSLRLREYGLEIGPIEILFLQGSIPTEAIQDVLDYQVEALARLDPEPPQVNLSIAPSARWLARQRPEDIKEADFLLGQFAQVAGAVTKEQVERAIAIFRRCRKGSKLGYPLGQILLDLIRGEPDNLRRLERAQRDLARFLGLPYKAPDLPLSSIEKELMRRRLDDGSIWSEEIVGQAVKLVWILAEFGIEKDEVEILVEHDLRTDRKCKELIEWREDRNRRIVGSSRTQAGDGLDRERSLFELAFSTQVSSSGWGQNNLGGLALETRMLTQPQLVQALYVQLQAREIGIIKPFGEILVELGFVNREQLGQLLDLQERRLGQILAETEEEPTAQMAPLDEQLFRRIRQTGALSDDRLRSALRTCSQIRALGLRGSLREVLIRRGDLDQEVVARLLTDDSKKDEEVGKKTGVTRILGRLSGRG